MRSRYFLVVISVWLCAKSSQAQDFVMAVGSCNKTELPNPFWKHILKLDPDVFVWGGDNIYADTADMDKMAAIYAAQKALPEYAAVIDSIKIIGTWDDHDFGKNDGGSDYKMKAESQKLLLDFLDVPKTDLRWSREGVYFSQVFGTENGSIKVISLDTRYFRSDLKRSNKAGRRYAASKKGTLLGEAQWQWFENELKNTSADFTVIMSSIQLVSHEHGFEKWANFPGERQRFFDLLKATNTDNLIVVSGDRHISEFSKITVDGVENPIIDFTSSGLTHAYKEYSGEPNEYRVGETVSDLSYAVIYFDLAAKKIKMQIRGAEDEVLEEIEQTYN